MTRVPPPRIFLPLMVTIERPDMDASELNDLKVRLANLQGSVDALLGEKYALAEANKRLAEQLQAVIAEKGVLEATLKGLTGMGIQQNDPEAFSRLAATAGAGKQTL